MLTIHPEQQDHSQVALMDLQRAAACISSRDGSQACRCLPLSDTDQT